MIILKQFIKYKKILFFKGVTRKISVGRRFNPRGGGCLKSGGWVFRGGLVTRKELCSPC